MDSEEPPLSPRLSQKKQAEADLETECENMWVHINQMHGRVNSESPLGVLGDTDTAMLSVYQAKAKHLQAELHTLDSKQPQALPTNPTVLRALLHKELSTSNKELEQTLELVQAQRKELEEELVREKALLQEHLEVKRTLKSKLEAASEEGTEAGTSKSAQEKELQRQSRAAVEQQQKLMRQLAGFVTKHFPKPTAQQMSGHKSKSKQSKHGAKEERSKEYMSLLEILEILMNKCTDSEKDPYVTVDDTSWPPYIELLLRCGLALRHPQDCNRIRLVPFHL